MNTAQREPAILIMGIVGALIQFISVFVFPLTDEQQGVLNGLVAVLVGAVTAALVSWEKVLPLLVGAVQAVLAVGIAFGLEWTPAQQTTLLALVGAIAAAWTRTQVGVNRPPGSLES